MAKKVFPGFIDIHTHLREPGAIHKENFETGSRAALKGGFTFIADMPNNSIPTISYQRLKQKVSLADKKAICDIGFHYGTTGRNIKSFKKAWQNPRVFGLKIFCNHTTGDLLVNDIVLLEKIFKGWQSQKPILVHAENVEMAALIALANLYKRRLHICHLAQAAEVELVRRAKLRKQQVTAGVCPHHLYLTDKDRKKMGGYAEMKPSLGTKRDQDELWNGLSSGVIDIIESDHAPHTKEEKEQENPAFGIPGLETAVGLMFKAVKDKKIKQSQIINLFHNKAKKIFKIPNQLKTYIEIDPGKEYIVGKEGYEPKCGWSSFAGWKLNGKVEKVVLRGKTLMENGRVI